MKIIVLILVLFCCLAAAYLHFSGATMSSKPFRIEFPTPLVGLGVIMVISGIWLISSESLRVAKREFYLRGYEKGAQDMSDTIKSEFKSGSFKRIIIKDACKTE